MRSKSYYLLLEFSDWNIQHVMRTASKSKTKKKKGKKCARKQNIPRNRMKEVKKKKEMQKNKKKEEKKPNETHKGIKNNTYHNEDIFSHRRSYAHNF